ncbi:MAG: UvrD-helicase domain-containing protein, partial [Candidatus Methylomirabilales bacterium]
MGHLRVIRAGAGSGKTTRLCEVVAEAVAGGLDPARVLATTFTRKAAAELKGRIQERLLTHPGLASRERIRLADRLELAAIGTVHSVGHQLLSRHALALGFSPRLTVLEEAGSAQALRELLGRMEPAPWEALAALTRRLSLGPPQELVLALLDAKRGNRIPGAALRGQLAASADRLCALMAPGGPSPAALTPAHLYARIEQALAGLAGITDATKTTAEALRELRRIVAARSGAWADFCWAAGIAAGKRSGADALLGPVRELAARVLASPELHADLRGLLARLGEQTLVLEQAYAEHKRERGQLDFTDLEVWLLRLLEDPAHAASVAADFALVVVDEFHDTNPLQLAIFQRLRQLAAESCWVGDAKQSIYGFRGTDPELIRAVWDAVPEEARERLPRNYRSQAGLVQLVGRLFHPLPGFGPEARLEPVRPGAPRGIERWLLRGRNVREDASALARGIQGLRAEGVALRDIAILARTNDEAQRVGAACRAAGLPALLELPGLLATREGALAVAGLRLVLDRRDSLAAATVLHLLSAPDVATPAWLAERLQAVRDAGAVEGPPPAPWAGDPRLAPLEAIDHRSLSPGVALQGTLDALAIGDHIRRWGDAPQRLANLDALHLFVEAYEREMQVRGSAATLSGLLAYLDELADGGTDYTRAPYGIDALTVLTYHGAKGLEWPVVVLTGLDAERDPDMWTVSVEGGDPASLDPLAGRAVRYWPWPFGSRSAGTDLDARALNAAEGQAAAERAGREGDRLLYVGWTRARDRLVLAHRPGRTAWLASLPEVDAVLPPDAADGEHPLGDIKTTYVVRRLDPVEAVQASSRLEQRWLAPLTGPEAPPVPARYHSPSAAEAPGGGVEVAIELLPGEPVFPDVRADQEAALGTAIHAYLTALPSLRALTRDQRRDVAVRCLRGFGVEALLMPGPLVDMGERCQAWVQARYPGATWHTEVPLAAPRAAGGQWYGAADLLLRLPTGELVIVDHKCGPVRRDQAGAKAASYAGQLLAYREVLAAQNTAVAALW